MMNGEFIIAAEDVMLARPSVVFMLPNFVGVVSNADFAVSNGVGSIDDDVVVSGDVDDIDVSHGINVINDVIVDAVLSMAALVVANVLSIVTGGTTSSGITDIGGATVS